MEGISGDTVTISMRDDEIINKKLIWIAAWLMVATIMAIGYSVSEGVNFNPEAAIEVLQSSGKNIALDSSTIMVIAILQIIIRIIFALIVPYCLFHASKEHDDFWSNYFSIGSGCCGACSIAAIFNATLSAGNKLTNIFQVSDITTTVIINIILALIYCFSLIRFRVLKKEHEIRAQNVMGAEGFHSRP